MKSKALAFSLIELLVALAVSSILVSSTVSLYGLTRKAITVDQSKADLTQNARVALDRMAREIRQTPEIITPLPDNPSDTSVAQPGYVEFENGHDNNLEYYRYYLSGTTLRLEKKEYFFTNNPSVRVRWNSTGGGGYGGGGSPLSNIISTQDIATSVQSLQFYGSNLVQIILTTNDGAGQSFTLRTNVYGRNI